MEKTKLFFLKFLQLICGVLVLLGFFGVFGSLGITPEYPKMITKEIFFCVLILIISVAIFFLGMMGIIKIRKMIENHKKLNT